MSATSVFQSISVADASLTSLPTILTTKKLSHPLRPLVSSLRFTSLNHHIPSLSLKRKNYGVGFVARISDWAQQQEVVAEEGEGEFQWGEGGTETEARVSDWEGKSGGEGGDFEGEEVGESGEEGGYEEEQYLEPPEEAKLFVGNLSYDVDSERLAQLFEKAGIVEVAEVVYNRDTDQSRGFGFVTMSTVEEAEKAVEMLNRYDLNGRLLTVNKASPRGSRGSRVERPPRQSEPSSRIYVGNLPWQVDDARLEQVFSEHGKVVDARVICDRESGRSRGFGFVTMSSKSEVDDAVAALDGQIVDGRALRVNVAEERPRRSSF